MLTLIHTQNHFFAFIIHVAPILYVDTVYYDIPFHCRPLARFRGRLYQNICPDVLGIISPDTWLCLLLYDTCFGNVLQKTCICYMKFSSIKLSTACKIKCYFQLAIEIFGYVLLGLLFFGFDLNIMRQNSTRGWYACYMGRKYIFTMEYNDFW